MPDLALTAKINFIYLWCNDIAAMRGFYSELLGLSEASYRKGPQGWLVYQCDGFQFMIFPASNKLSVAEGWGVQPGWEGGDRQHISWSVIVPTTTFAGIVRKLLDAKVESFNAVPQWCQDAYWSFPVRDPMGNTVELHCIPATRPASTEWSWGASAIG